MNTIRCKVAILGDPRVGKSSIVSQLVKNNFNYTYQTTLGIDYNQFEVQIPDTIYSVQFHILDFTGFSIYRDLINKAIKNVNFILYVYDSTNLESFQNIQLWKMSVNEMNLPKSVQEYLVGNKIEIPEKVTVNKGSIDSVSKNYKLKPFSVSARMNSGLKELFDDIAKNCYDNYINFITKVKSL